MASRSGHVRSVSGCRSRTAGMAVDSAVQRLSPARLFSHLHLCCCPGPSWFPELCTRPAHSHSFQALRQRAVESSAPYAADARAGIRGPQKRRLLPGHESTILLVSSLCFGLLSCKRFSTCLLKGCLLHVSQLCHFRGNSMDILIHDTRQIPLLASRPSSLY